MCPKFFNSFNVLTVSVQKVHLQCMHTLSRFLCSLMPASITFCYRLHLSYINQRGAASAYRYCSHDVHKLAAAQNPTPYCPVDLRIIKILPLITVSRLTSDVPIIGDISYFKLNS